MELIDVTPSMAKEWLLNNDYEYQRVLKGNFVRGYASEMEKQHFKQYTVIEFAHIDDRKFLMDGQHRLAAISRLAESTPLYVQQRYYDNIAGVAADYARTDIGRKRSWSDVVNSLHDAMGIKEKLVLTNADLNALKSAFYLIYRGFMKDGFGLDFVTLYEKTLEWQPYAKLYFDIIGNNSGNIICRSLRRKYLTAMAICTIRFADYHLSEDKSAIDFWKQVLVDDGLGKDDPRKKLNHILRESRVQGNSRHAKNYTSKELALYAARAWQAYCNDEELRFIRLPKASTISIKYTPFDGSMKISQYKTFFENGDWGKKWIST